MKTILTVVMIAASFCTVLSTEYQITDLGTLGGYHSRATGINANGQVVGIADTTVGGNNHAFLWSDGLMHDLGTFGGTLSDAQGINASGQVVGDSYVSGNTSQRIFRYSGGQMEDLGTLGGEPNHGGAYAINSQSQVVGYSWVNDMHHHAFLYSNGSMHDLGAQNRNSVAYSINNASTIVGGAEFVSGLEHAFIYSNGSMLDIGTLGGYFSRAYGINEIGQVVGFAYGTDNILGQAFLYSNGYMFSLNTEIGVESQAFGINTSSQIVGFLSRTQNEESHRAFLYSDGIMLDLNTLIDPSSGWILREATAINDSGQIVGRGINSSGHEHAFLLTQIPEPTVFSLFFLAAMILARKR